jgi:hypothetical protein
MKQGRQKTPLLLDQPEKWHPWVMDFLEKL